MANYGLPVRLVQVDEATWHVYAGERLLYTLTANGAAPTYPWPLLVNGFVLGRPHTEFFAADDAAQLGVCLGGMGLDVTPLADWLRMWDRAAATVLADSALTAYSPDVTPLYLVLRLADGKLPDLGYADVVQAQELLRAWTGAELQRVLPAECGYFTWPRLDAAVGELRQAYAVLSHVSAADLADVQAKLADCDAGRQANYTLALQYAGAFNRLAQAANALLNALSVDPATGRVSLKADLDSGNGARVQAVRAALQRPAVPNGA